MQVQGVTRNPRIIIYYAPLECKNSARVKCINFLGAFPDGLPTPERSERLEVKNDDSSTAQAQNIHRRRGGSH